MSNVTAAELISVANYGDMPCLPLDKASQWFVICVTICSILLFAFDYLKGKIGWEGLYVNCIEIVGYICSVGLDAKHIPTVGPRNEPLLRYVSWLLTCPILIKVLCSLVAVDMDSNSLNKLIVMDICMTMCGILGVMYDNLMAQQAFFWTGMVLGFVIVKKVVEFHVASADKLNKLHERRCYFAFFLSTWTIYPLLYILGPPMYDLISQGTSIVLHSFGDFVAKNIFSLMAWKMNRDWSPSNTRKEKNAAKQVDDTCNKAKGVNNALAPTITSETLQHVVDGEGSVILSVQTPRPDLRYVDTPQSNMRSLQPSPDSDGRHLQLNSGTPVIQYRQLVHSGQVTPVPHLPLKQVVIQSEQALAPEQYNLGAAENQYAMAPISVPSLLNISRRLSAIETGFGTSYAGRVKPVSSEKKSKKKKKKKAQKF